MDIEQTDLFSNILIDENYLIVSFTEYTASLINNLMNITLHKGMSVFEIIADYNKKIFEDIFAYAFKGEFIRKEFIFNTDTGGKLYYDYLFNPILDDNNTVKYVSVSAIDITKYKKHLISIEESEKRYKGIVDNSTSLLIRLDTEGRFIFVNDICCRILGKTLEELKGEYFMPLAHPDDIPETSVVMEALNTPPYQYVLEQRLMTANGWRWFYFEDTAIKNDKGEIIEVQAVGRDITELKESINSLTDTNELLNGILSSSPIAIVVIDKEGKVNFWSQGAERIFQWTSFEVINKFNPIVKKEEYDLYKDMCTKIFKGESFKESNIEKRRKDGSVVIVDITRVPLKNSDGIVTAGLITYQDVTSKVNAELENIKLSSAFNFSSSAIAMLNGNLMIEYINEKYSRLTGYSFKEIKGKYLKDIMPPQMTNAEYDNLLNVIQNSSEWRSEVINITKSGEFYWENVIIYPVTDIKGKIINYLLIKEDISENKKAFQELVNSRLRLGAILNNFPNIVLYEYGGKNPFISSNVQNVLGYPPDKFLNEKIFFESIIIDEDKGDYINALSNWSSNPGTGNFKFNFRCRNSENEIIWVENIISSVFDGDSAYYCGILQDISDFKETENKIIWNETLLKIMTDNTRFGYYVANKKEDSVLYVNEKFCDLWNIKNLYEKMKNREIKSSEVMELCSKIAADSDYFLQITTKYNNPDNQITFEDEIILDNGRTLRRFSSLLSDSNGDYLGRFYLYEDITEKKFHDRIRKNQSDYKTLIEQSLDAIILFDLKGKINASNKNASDLLGYSKKDFTKMNVIDLFDTSDPDYEDLKFLDAFEGKTILAKRKLIKKDGSRIYAEIHSKMLPNRLIQSVIWDIGKPVYDNNFGKNVSFINPYVNLFNKLKAFKHGENSLNCLNRISLFLKNYVYIFDSKSTSKTKEKEVIKRFLDLIDEYNHSVNSQIEYIISILNRLKNDIPESTMTEDLLKAVNILDDNSKNLYSKLKYIRTSFKSLLAETKPVIKADELIDAIQKIKSGFKTINRLFEEHFSSDLKEVIQNIIRYYSFINRNLRVEYKDNSDFGKIVFNKGELFDAIKIFFDNAIEAYENSNNPAEINLIELELNKHSDEVILSFKDFGPGISDSVKSLLFTKGVSTKGPNRGFGLSYSNTLFLKYGGKFLLDKDFKEGAKFNLIFKII